jgi:hypothetical protein
VRILMFTSLWYNTTRVLLTQPVGFAGVDAKDQSIFTGLRIARNKS